MGRTHSHWTVGAPFRQPSAHDPFPLRETDPIEEKYLKRGKHGAPNDISMARIGWVEDNPLSVTNIATVSSCTLILILNLVRSRTVLPVAPERDCIPCFAVAHW